MNSALKAEARKLLTVRSTYILSALALIMAAFFAFYIFGYKLGGTDLQNPYQLASSVTGALTVSIFATTVGILSFTHEYRYNTINYTLTSSNSRSKVLLSKILVVSIFALVFSAVLAVISPALSYLGALAHGNHFGPQVLQYWDLAWRSLFYGWAYAMFGLLLAAFSRSQIASIAALFVIPGVAEQLLTLLVKKNGVYLPFSALGQILEPGGGLANSYLLPNRAALVVSAYLVIGGIVAWVLFLRRDAS